MSSELAVQAQGAPLFAIATLTEAVDFASQMARAKLIPAHLQNSPADCLRVVMQAARWQMDPFAIADKTSVISGKLMYEGQLVAAVINSRGKMKKKLKPIYSGEGANRKLIVVGQMPGEDEDREIELTHAQATKINKNGQMQQNPDQQMWYIGCRIWSRRHSPELMLGVYTPDEITEEEEPQNVTPQQERAPVPERSAKGVAAAKENAASIKAQAATQEAPAKREQSKVVEAEFTDVPAANQTVNAPQQEKAPELKSIEKVAEKPADKPSGKTVPVTTLQRGQVINFENIEVTDAVKKVINGVPGESMVVTLKGGYVGVAYHLSGGADPAWVGLKHVNVTLSGKAQKSGNIIAFVEKVEPADVAPDMSDDIT